MARKKGKRLQRIPINKYPFSPSTYPGRRPRFSFFFTPRGIYRCNLGTLQKLLERGNLPSIDRRYAVLAYGSNACPGQLKRKFEGHGLTNVPVLYGHLTGAEAVYARRRTGAGYIPATLAATGGSRPSWITLLAADQFEAMDASEGRPDYYALTEVQNIVFTVGRSRIRLAPLYAYVNVKGGVMAANGDPVRLRTTTQKRCQRFHDDTESKPAEECLAFVTISDLKLPPHFSRILRQ